MFDQPSNAMNAAIMVAHDLPKKKVKHRAMGAAEQVQTISDLEQKIHLFGGPTKHPPLKSKKRRTLSPQPDTSSPVEIKMEAFAQHMTPPAETPPDEKVVPSNAGQRIRKPTKSTSDTFLGNMPSRVTKLMKTLNDFGVPFEKALSRVAEISLEELSRESGNELLVADLLAQVRDWKTSNRMYLRHVEALLSRHGIVGIGGVEVPSGPL